MGESSDEEKHEDDFERLLRNNPPPPPQHSEEESEAAMQYIRNLAEELGNKEQEWVSAYERHGADKKLAFAMEVIFEGYFQASGSLEEIAASAQSALSGKDNNLSLWGVSGPHASYYEMLGFVMMVKGDKELARHYMQKAVELQPRDIVLANFDLAYDVLQAALPDLNRIRAERYEKEPFELPKHDEMQNT